MMRGVGRTMAVFDCFTEDRPSLNLQSIANRVGLPKSTTFRLVQSLEQAGYLVRLENQEYCLSHKFVRLAGLVQISADIRAIARSVMEEAARAGAVILKPPQSVFWGGYTGYFQDPDGHVWEIAWNPKLPLE